MLYALLTHPPILLMHQFIWMALVMAFSIMLRSDKMIMELGILFILSSYFKVFSLFNHSFFHIRQVNLMPADKPQDVYSEVAFLVEKARQNDANNGDVLAKELDGLFLSFVCYYLIFKCLNISFK